MGSRMFRNSITKRKGTCGSHRSEFLLARATLAGLTLEKGAPLMNLEIHTPELEQRVRRPIQSGQFHDVDELLSRALDALEEKAPLPGSAAPESSQTKQTGAAILEVLQSSPYREIDLTPTRVPIFV